MNPIAGPGVPPHVNDLMRALDDAEQRVTVPAAVDEAVMRAWDAAHASRTPRTPSHAWPRTMWPIAAAAAIVLLAVAARTLRPGPRPLEVSRVQAIIGTQVAPQRALAAASVPVATRAHRASRRTQQPPQVATLHDDVGWILIADPAFDSSAATVIRVRMPRSALAALGLPIAEPDAAGAVDVEMLVGEDGVARTIRRASAAPANPDQE
jgi:hypothetical protein